LVGRATRANRRAPPLVLSSQGAHRVYTTFLEPAFARVSPWTEALLADASRLASRPAVAAAADALARALASLPPLVWAFGPKAVRREPAGAWAAAAVKRVVGGRGR
jgi:hypothetical protein